jgi:cell division protein FtsI (penicillin-binding protein 3)
MIYFPSENQKPVKSANTFAVRRFVLLGVIICAMLLLVARAVDLQVINKDFLQTQGTKRHISVVPVSTYRGKILDRAGEIMAISSPVQSVWVNAQELDLDQQQAIRQMIALLELPRDKVELLTHPDPKQRFVYLKRRISPELAEKVKLLQINGVYFEREFKRFYPAGPMAAHIVGFTNSEDVGQEGIERSYEKSLAGTDGSKRVIRDGKRRIIEDVENIKEPVPGKDLILSIDRRIQYLAYRELQAAFLEHQAKSASLVVLNAKTGEILAAVTQPAFNPNSRENLKESLYRNRAITDVYEPGSSVKPFVVAAAVDGGYIAEGAIFTSNGPYTVGHNQVRDGHNYGTLDLAGVLKKSSNIGAAQIGLKMPGSHFWNIYHNLGFGTSANVGFPGEAKGSLLSVNRVHGFAQATLSFGYALSVSTLQLARAYTALADDGIVHSVSLLKREHDPEAKRIFKAKTAKKVRQMMEHVIDKDGTAYAARVDGYRVAGKTGTVRKATGGGYSNKKYFAVFAGMAPASHPRFVVVVVVDEPGDKEYYGGVVSAPIFSKVMAGALRIYGVESDEQNAVPILLTKQGLHETQ